MEDCLHTSSDNLAKLVKWAHSHGTICTLIPSLKHLLTEGAHGNLTALWGCSAGHAYHWPLTATCKSSQKERVCYPNSRSINAENLMQGTTGGSGSQRERFLEHASKGKGNCGQAGDSCDFSNCSEPSEADDNVEEYNSSLFDIVCESSATDEDGDSEPHQQHAPLRKRTIPGVGAAEERAGDPAIKKIKQETSEDYYTVANAQLAAGSEGGPSSTVVSQSPRPSSHTRPSSLSSLSHKPSSMDGDSLGVSPLPTGSSSSPHPQSMVRPMRAPLHSAQSKAPSQSSSAPAGALHLPSKSELLDRMPGDELAKSSVPYGDLGTAINTDLDLMAAQTLNADSRADASVSPALYEIERLKALLQAEKSKIDLMGDTITSLKQDKELLQQELTKKAELICDFLQDQLRPEKRRAHSSNQMEPGSSHQLINTYPEEGGQFESPALFDSFEEVELHPLDRQRIKISKRCREGENTRVRMKNVVGVIARYMAALQEFRRSVSMKVAFDRIGVDRNTISRTAAIAELSLAAPEVFHALPPWDEKEETLARYAVRCRQAMDDNIKAKIKAMKAKGELLPIVSK
ncbi:uncharacterized protein KIAA1958 isoform X3 [Clupea harengus]|uniref:Uncharacterized protein KIAA1958 isoform X3 n=1 Tax=Clupea harengus TaxID=7950 RepID=A0A6P8GGW8_CLUHA|nr:uncharacterized protein KIAA1958 isoform X3 [Clupea harengus]